MDAIDVKEAHGALTVELCHGDINRTPGMQVIGSGQFVSDDNSIGEVEFDVVDETCEPTYLRFLVDGKLLMVAVLSLNERIAMRREMEVCSRIGAKPCMSFRMTIVE